ncbi:FecCD family ABC transporter permease [Cumulibacter soli]|uniref:FecCD family ABC transporter permease n=1 Tax=Cumulibacter soli TaxID=2546344 RepID=UPI001068485C|nr:iron chelate uptake ABC transporter family permease subunit [Cumulibacter soli]
MQKPTTSHGRLFFWLCGLVALLLAVMVLSLMIGARALSPGTVLEAVFQRDLTNPDHTPIWDGRIPRTVLALVAGIAVGVAGAVIQGLTRNPLADPGVLGVNAGAAFCVVLAVGIFGIQPLLGYIWFAFFGALVASVSVYLIGRSRTGADPARLVLAGVALSAVLEGIGQGLALLNPQAFDRLRTWNLGIVDVGTLTPTWQISGFVLTGLVLAALCARGLNAIALGEEAATSLGASVRTTRILAVAAVTLLAGSVAATAGVIIFLGLMVPHLARRISGPDNRWVIVLSAVIAPITLIGADVLGRVLLPGELPAGIVVAFVGAPFLIAIARRRRVAAL